MYMAAAVSPPPALAAAAAAGLSVVIHALLQRLDLTSVELSDDIGQYLLPRVETQLSTVAKLVNR